MRPGQLTPVAHPPRLYKARIAALEAQLAQARQQIDLLLIQVLPQEQA